jgi:hypothetical protein
MTQTIPISIPAGYAPAVAAHFAAPDGGATAVSATQPLPVVASRPAAAPALAGTASTSAVVGPFAPVANAPVYLALSGQWSGTVRVTRSTDGGATRLPLSAGGTDWARFVANACEPIWEEGEPAARLYLDITVISGAVTYRLGQ